MITRKGGERESKHHHREMLIWPFVLGECEGSCGRGRLGFNRRCRPGLDCARDNREALASAGFDLQFSYCGIPNFRGRRYFCYDPTKLNSPSVRPSSKPSAQPSKKSSSKPSRKPSVSSRPTGKPSSKPSSQPTPTTTPKKCFTTNAELKSAASLYNASNITETYGNSSDWCVQLVTDFSFVFSYNSFNEDVSKWNTSSATNMAAMFGYAESFNQDISKWDVSKVTNMFNMFYGATSFNQDISKWDVSKVTNMKFMFTLATSFNQSISKWDVSKVTSMSYMFYGATSFNQDLSSWNISKVTSMAYMFYHATSFNKNLCSWNAKRQPGLDATGAFVGASSCPNQTPPVCGSGPFCYNCH